MARFVFWSLVLCNSFFFAGHLYEITVLVPNWSSGTPEDVARYRDFLVHSGPGTYFAYIASAVLAHSLAAIAVFRRHGTQWRWLSAAPLAVLLLYSIWTMLYFVLINRYVGRQTYDPSVLKSMVDGWVFWEYPRTGLVAAGLAASIALLDRYSKQPGKQEGTSPLPHST